MSITPHDRDEGPPVDVSQLIRLVNASNEAVEDLYLRARQAADIAARSTQAAAQAAAAATKFRVGHQIIQAENAQRRASLPRQRFIALLTVILDAVACYFAAQALDSSQDTTYVWTVLFLAVLAIGEIALDYYRDRRQRAWRMVAAVLTLFVVGLGALRFWFLATVGASGLIPAMLGATLFTLATGGFLLVGYRSLRMAETPQAFRARRTAQAAAQAAVTARLDANRNTRDSERLIDAYLVQVRRRAVELCTPDQQSLEQAVRRHLRGEEPA